MNIFENENEFKCFVLVSGCVCDKIILHQYEIRDSSSTSVHLALRNILQ